MSTIVSSETTSPNGLTETCVQFEIPDAREKYCFAGVMSIDTKYTLSFWAKAEQNSVLSVNGESISIETEWTRHTFTFVADSENLEIVFNTIGVYYIYQMQLEIGNVATDYTPAPEDVEEEIYEVAQNASNAQQTANGAAEQLTYAKSQIQQLADSISMMVRNGTAGSLVKQDANGLYYFDISGIENNISINAGELAEINGIVLDANGKIDVLQSTAEALKERTEYVRTGTLDGQPCLELGEGDSSFKVYLTNTELRFVDGTSVPAYISNQKLYIEKAEVLNELRFGGFVWKMRSNGNMGLVWEGAGS
jgi:hypothetical protein